MSRAATAQAPASRSDPLAQPLRGDGRAARPGDQAQRRPDRRALPTARELAERLAVSRVTVREALRALEQAGLVDIRRGRHGGAYVLGIEPRPARGNAQARKLARALGAELEDSLDLRWAIEPATATSRARARC